MILVILEIVLLSSIFVFTSLIALDSWMEQRYILVELFRPTDVLSNFVVFNRFADWCLVGINSEADPRHLDVPSTLCKCVFFEDATAIPLLLVVAVNIKELLTVDKVFFAPLVVFLGLSLKLGYVG